jgi:UDP-N-acetylglucosamine 2-epimerase (non-hydrolysing)
VYYPVHPRTRHQIQRHKLLRRFGRVRGLRMIEPLGYIDFMKLVKHASGVLTDSGGLQEETTSLGIPCVTLRQNTERPVTVIQGTNVLVGSSQALLLQAVELILGGRWKAGRTPRHWDGRAAERIVEVLESREGDWNGRGR